MDEEFQRLRAAYRRSGRGQIIQISADDKAILHEMREEILSLQHQWSPSPDRADYECAFCGRNPPTNRDMINHKDNCVGVKYYAFVDKLIDQLQED